MRDTGRFWGGIQAVTRTKGAGREGIQKGKVRLPTMTDYRPPKEFREDLLEAMKENYPKIYEEIIHDYYKRLAQ